MTRLEELNGRVAFVTGGGSGIGEALARHAARLGMTAIVADRDADRAGEVAAGIRDDGGRARPCVVDVADWESVAAAAAEVFAHDGVPGFLACNAGIEHAGFAWETSAADWARVQAVNVNGAFNVMRAFVPAMLERGGPGHVLFTSSLGGIKISALQSAYAVSKHAVRVLAQSLQADLDAAGATLGVSILLPGPVQTRIFEDALTAEDDSAQAFRQGRVDYLRADGLTPGQVAELVFRAVDSGKRWIYPHPAKAREQLVRHTAGLLASAADMDDDA